MRIPSPANIHMLDSLAKKRILSEHLLLWLIMCAAVAVLVHPWGTVSWSLKHPTISWVAGHQLTVLLLFGAVTFLTSISFKILDRVVLAGAVKLSAAPQDWLGRHSAEDIQCMVNECISALKKERAEQAKVFILKSPEANAASINSYFLNHLEHRNAIYLSSFVLRVLENDELKALIGHELGHFYHYQSPLVRAPFLLNWSLSVLWLGTVWRLFGAGGSLSESLWLFSWWGTLLLLIPGVLWIIGRVRIRTMDFSHVHEFLADHTGATVADPLAMINALLKIGSRQEIFVKTLEHTKELMKSSSKANALQVLEHVRTRLPDTILTLEEALNSVRFATASVVPETLSEPDDANSGGNQPTLADLKNSLRQLQDLIGREEAKRLLDWQEFDTHVQDYRLDETEIRLLMNALMANPHLYLFSLPGEDGPRKKMSTHPTFRARLVQIVHSFDLLAGHDG